LLQFCSNTVRQWLRSGRSSLETINRFVSSADADRFSLAHDGNGNALSDGLRSFTWANDNTLASVVMNGNVVSFATGPDGSRAAKTSGPIGAPASGQTVTRFYGPESEQKNGAFTRFPHPDVMIEGNVVSAPRMAQGVHRSN
jgi:hypothetical protein